MLTGDVHSNWVFDLPRRPFDGFDLATGRGSLGIEFAGTSVTSPSPVGAGVDGEQQLIALRAARPHLHYVDGRVRGYYVLDLSHARLQADFYAVKTIERRTSDEGFLKGYAAPAGQMHCHRTGLTRDIQGVGSGSGALIPCGSASSRV